MAENRRNRDKIDEERKEKKVGDRGENERK